MEGQHMVGTPATGLTSNSTCQQLVFGREDGSVNPLLLSVGMIQLVVYLVLMLGQLCKKIKAARGIPVTGNLTMFPVHMYIMLGFGASLVGFLVGNIVFTTRPYVADYGVEEGVVWGVVNFLYHTAIDGILVFLCFTGAGLRSLCGALGISALFGIIYGVGISLALLADHWAPHKDLNYGLGVQLGIEGLLLLLYLAVLVLPQRCFPRRPAAFTYAACWTVYRPIYITLIVLMYLRYDASYCVYFSLITLLWSAFKPVLIFYTLRRDQEYWLGAMPRELRPGRRGKKRRGQDDAIPLGSSGASDSGEDETAPLLPLMQGDQLDGAAASALSGYMDVVSDLCPIIDLAKLRFRTPEKDLSAQELEKQRLLGAGGTGRVYRGIYEGKGVAIKMLYCIQLEKETIRNFCLENSLLCTIRHPNVVEGEGVCVAPPAIASVMELCQGNLLELFGVQREHQELAEWDVRINIAIDCARGVHCLHRLGLVHCDIKSCNFLVGKESVSKWTNRDVLLWLKTIGLEEFVPDFRREGITGWGTGPHSPGLFNLEEANLRRIVSSRRRQQRPSFAKLVQEVRDLRRYFSSRAGLIAKITDLELSRQVSHSFPGNISFETAERSVIQCTPNWTAPELLAAPPPSAAGAAVGGQRPQPTHASDVYSLSMVLWEILTGEVPFANVSNLVHHVCERQQRPDIPTDTDEAYAQLLEDMWHHDPRERPTMQQVLERLLDMKRRFHFNRTIANRTFDDKASTIATSADTYIQQRFGPPSAQTQRLPSEARYSFTRVVGAGKRAQQRTPQRRTTPQRYRSHKRSQSMDTAALLDMASLSTSPSPQASARGSRRESRGRRERTAAGVEVLEPLPSVGSAEADSPSPDKTLQGEMPGQASAQGELLVAADNEWGHSRDQAIRGSTTSVRHQDGNVETRLY